MLSFGMPGRRRSTVPSASTASKPPVCRRIDPWRRTLTPPAFVATIPPIVAASRAPKSTPTSQPAARAADCAATSVTPAPTVISPPSGSTSSMPSRRRRLITTSPPRGTDPPTSPVLPPWGTTPTPASVHARSTAATSSVDAGRTTASAVPDQRRVQSVSYEARRSGSVRQWLGPTISASRATSADVFTR